MFWIDIGEIEANGSQTPRANGFSVGGNMDAAQGIRNSVISSYLTTPFSTSMTRMERLGPSQPAHSLCPRIRWVTSPSKAELTIA
jgi:hypothetical protein